MSAGLDILLAAVFGIPDFGIKVTKLCGRSRTFAEIPFYEMGDSSRHTNDQLIRYFSGQDPTRVA